MSQVQSGSEAAAAALVGSLSNFSLIDVLDLLARTGHTGELQVVGRGIDRHVWVDQGDLVDASGTGGLQAVLFELACRDEGWFYFSCTTGVPEGAERLTVSDVIGDLGPQVEEWRGLNEALPFDATVAMSSTTPSDDVQIKGSQWALLTAVGSNGRSVRDVVDGASGHPLDTLRSLRELSEAGLIEVTAPAVREEPPPAAPPPPPPPPGEGDTGTAWNQSSVAEPVSTGSRSGDSSEPPLPPFVRPGNGVSDAPPAPDGYTTGEVEVVDADAVMPPPINSDPWSSSLATEESTSSS
jgi:hypothetical protein